MKENDSSNEAGGNRRVAVNETWSNREHPSTAIVRAVAVASDRDPTEMPPLYDHVDLDALDKLLGTGDLQVTISYEDYRIVADSDGSIRVLTET